MSNSTPTETSDAPPPAAGPAPLAARPAPPAPPAPPARRGGRGGGRGRGGRPPNINENSLMRRLECIISVENRTLTMHDACKVYDISQRTYYRWLRSKDRLMELTCYSEQQANDDQAGEAGSALVSPRNSAEVAPNAKRMPRGGERDGVNRNVPTDKPISVMNLQSVRRAGAASNTPSTGSSTPKNAEQNANNAGTAAHTMVRAGNVMPASSMPPQKRINAGQNANSADAAARTVVRAAKVMPASSMPLQKRMNAGQNANNADAAAHTRVRAGNVIPVSSMPPQKRIHPVQERIVVLKGPNSATQAPAQGQGHPIGQANHAPPAGRGDSGRKRSIDAVTDTEQEAKRARETCASDGRDRYGNHEGVASTPRSNDPRKDASIESRYVLVKNRGRGGRGSPGGCARQQQQNAQSPKVGYVQPLNEQYPPNGHMQNASANGGNNHPPPAGGNYVGAEQPRPATYDPMTVYRGAPPRTPVEDRRVTEEGVQQQQQQRNTHLESQRLAWPPPYWDTGKRRLEIMLGRRKVVIGFYRGSLAADIKDSIARRFGLLKGAQWALIDQDGDEIVVSDGMPSGRYVLNIFA